MKDESVIMGAFKKANKEYYFIIPEELWVQVHFQKYSTYQEMPLGAEYGTLNFMEPVWSLHGSGRNPRILSSGLKQFVRTTKRNPLVTARHLQDDLRKGGISVSMATIRRTLNKQGPLRRTPPLTTIKISIKS